MKQNSGFSLIELLIVMAVLSLLFSLSIGGLINFQAQTELKQDGTQILTLFDLIRNSAKNDVRNPTDPNSLKFRGYTYMLSQETDPKLRIQLCIDQSNITGLAKDRWVCSSNYSDYIEGGILNLEIPFNFGRGNDNQTYSGIIPKCAAIYFEFLTADILVQDINSSTIDTTKKCYFEITDTRNVFTNYVYIDGVLDNYEILPNVGELIAK